MRHNAGLIKNVITPFKFSCPSDSKKDGEITFGTMDF